MALKIKGGCPVKKSTFISLIALGTAIVGVLIALAAYFGKKRTALYEEMDDDFDFEDPDDIEYYSTNVDEDSECDCCTDGVDDACDCGCECGCYDDSEPCDCEDEDEDSSK